MPQLSASPMRMVASIEALLAPGREPGRPRQTAHTWVLGSAPKPVGQPQNIFERVPSSTWTSSPMTGSYRRAVAVLALALMRISLAADPIIGGSGLAYRSI